eukprot:CAMPEP_0202961574 /NCGR_PEP_ID=MMETSP1396-20130829/5635_1 /ASSEMBLY_ACC=CAM_ASM_000872 /TAXON_ID= /ORGANISM="Pseudokeronopsis sp., Strain Brazil" /LENGTH=70 /DNA_ID=CAMNT_0049681493 /DNA_START=362 /DNA_END=574 /DNA_ORIENTATION=+
MTVVEGWARTIHENASLVGEWIKKERANLNKIEQDLEKHRLFAEALLNRSASFDGKEAFARFNLAVAFFN